MLHYFNPGHEGAVHNGSSYYIAPANVVLMQKELDFLPAWYADNEDVVLVSDDFDTDFYRLLKRKFPELPKPVKKEYLPQYDSESVVFWGVSPNVVHQFFELNKSLNLNLDIPKWENDFFELTSRETANKCLLFLIEKVPETFMSVPHLFQTLKDAEIFIFGSQSILIAKAPFSSSGRGLLWIRPSDYNRATQQILRGIFNKQGSVSIEQALDKQLDFAMEFISSGDGKIKFIGYSLFKTNKKGSYLGNTLTSQQNIEKTLDSYIPVRTLESVKENLLTFLSGKFRKYKGCIGVDMLVYSDGNQYKLYPCVEINMRSNMGLVALKMSENYLVENAEGRFIVDYSKYEGEIYKQHLHLFNENPPIFENGKLLSGYFPLCPVLPQSHYWAYVIVE